ncbi:phosphoglycerate/bisphosphoglycerate mutase active site [Trichococcus palustris]|uniref:Phosphoglycerate/bisphosphoglycerate mutase active site n=2 Tax=Trichococcus palustris TaxID=140314 RepID=A0A143YUF2_9LACT|nr:histidine phosphatase family protein [Trichococcus palustris]CZQ98471.1 phosphoglycerate/bisphosphoglycerate mutase active site [Trichococcus palustris]SFK94710.1 probable phosphoglycerate mutase [Trichococcus palustris]
MKKTFYLMRHGQTLFNVRRKIQGSCDSPLTELGIQQAKVASAYFSDISLDHAYSSTAERSSDTLEIVTNNEMPYTRLKGLKEMHFGAFEGESEDLNPEDKSTFFLQYGGESGEQVRERVVKTCKEIMEQDDHHSVLAVSHAGACIHFLSAWQDPHEVLQKGVPNCCIFKYEYDVTDKNFTLLEVIQHGI